MKHTVLVRLDRAYMSESYDLNRRYGNRWLLIERGVGVLAILYGLFLLSEGDEFLWVIFVALGTFELCSNYLRKYVWLRRHFKSKLADAQVELTIDDEGIHSHGPFSSGSMRWNGIERILRTPKGLLIWPQKGMYIYLPKSAAEENVIDFVASRVESIAA
jgi:hypothetical protein